MGRLALGRLFAPLLLIVAAGAVRAEGIAVVGHESVPRLDAVTVQRIFTGRVVELNGVQITAVNLARGSGLRGRFLASFVGQDEEKYVAYWTVRRFVGLGMPPAELASSAEVIQFVSRRPGAVGYVDASEVPPGVKVLLLK
mgnify:CR=1 FL=1